MIARLFQTIDGNFGTYRGLARSLLADGEYVVGRLTPFLAPDLARVSRLVFVCLGNINRSAFAGAVAGREGIRSVSIGLSTTTGAPAFETALALAPRYGVDLSSHRATDISDHRPMAGDLALCMEIRHLRRLRASGYSPSDLSLLGHWAEPRRLHLHDPHHCTAAYFRTCFSLIASAVRSLAADLRLANSPSVCR